MEIEHTTANGVAVRVYVPRSTPATVGLVWVHGGGFTQGGLDVPHAHLVAAQLARRTPAVVVSVGYRLATGGVHYPVPHDDVRSAWAWACGRARELGSAPEWICGCDQGICCSDLAGDATVPSGIVAMGWR
ncbi:alpha/beta hydrolase [Streptomyces sp. NPDC001793]|uniref:alpha/beta hydrolase n=1 Tax=Streptomyces sp. NPDC001793 TaxID=3154657 RepID=UPI003316C9AC